LNPTTSSVVLARGEWQVKITAEKWAEILLFLNKRGWRPSVPTHYLLAGDFDLLKQDASSLAAAGQKVLDEALNDPLAFYPVPIDMGKLAEIVCFCEEGAFRICR
jgi:hypothetical protein